MRLATEVLMLVGRSEKNIKCKRKRKEREKEKGKEGSLEDLRILQRFLSGALSLCTFLMPEAQPHQTADLPFNSGFN